MSRRTDLTPTQIPRAKNGHGIFFEWAYSLM
jgi:hypothetical protein